MKIEIDMDRKTLEDKVSDIIADNPNISMLDLLKKFQNDVDTKKLGYSMYEIITMTPGMAGEVLIDECNKINPDIELIKEIIEHSQVDINVKDHHGSTALIIASHRGFTEVVRILLQHNEIDVNLHNEDVTTALMMASGWGRTEIVKLLLERPEIDVNLQGTNGWNALMIASRNGRTEIARMLFERLDIDVNLRNSEGETALMWASANGYTEVVRLLLERPEINKKIKSRNKTAWGMASQSIRNQFPELKPSIKKKATNLS